jgi:DNA (cytosine-5)-methyltransferase 1
MKVLNLYSGIGGNRKLWSGVQVTAVEYNSDIAAIYQDYFPNDTVIVGDAHKYLLDNFKDFDFIWSSPPCPSHSRARFWGYKESRPIYPDMTLYQEILFLKHHFTGKWVIENTIPYYEPLINAVKIGRHLFWSNFKIGKIEANDNNIHAGTNSQMEKLMGYDLSKYTVTTDKYSGARAKLELLRNCVSPETGLYILNRAMNIHNSNKIEQRTLWS